MRFLDLVDLRLEARLVVIYLATADWNYQRAVERYMAERYDEDGFELADHQATSKGSTVYTPTPLAPHPDDLLTFDSDPDDKATGGESVPPTPPQDDNATGGESVPPTPPQNDKATEKESTPAAPPQLVSFTFRDICPCNLDGHKCMLPKRCKFIKDAICTLRVSLGTLFR